MFKHIKGSGDKVNKETVLITGASSGIGKELTYRFATDQHPLVLVARSERKLNELKKDLEAKYQIPVTVIVSDLSTEEGIKEMYEFIKNEQMIVDILVNNAGFGLFGDFLETKLEDELNMIDLNVRALTHLTKLFLPEMVNRNRGGILNVASTAAFQPGPLMAVYYATKAYVLSFSEALSEEVKGTNVTVTALCPGPTQTNFSERANLGKSKLFKNGVMDVKEVADVGYKGFKEGKSVVIPGFQNKMLASSVRFMPRKMVTSVVRKVQDKVD